jgi:hypothetical protein
MVGDVFSRVALLRICVRPRDLSGSRVEPRNSPGRQVLRVRFRSLYVV